MESRSFVSSEDEEVRRSATLLCLDTPQDSEFGIDDFEFTCGPNFKGIKLIPAGIHFIFYSAGAKYGGIGPPRSGFFLNFLPSQVRILKWNPSSEDFDIDTELNHDEMSRYKEGVKRFDFDRFLGAYDRDEKKRLEKWKTLSFHINPRLLEILEPSGKRISSLYENSNDSLNSKMNEQLEKLKESRSFKVEKTERNEEAYTPHFSKIPSNKELACGMDKSAILEYLIEKFKGKEFDLLGELQFSFCIFLLGQCYSGFEQWKRLLYVICSCESAMEKRGKFFAEFVAVFHFQLKQIPQDFFDDVISSGNFLTQLLRGFLEMLEEEKLDPLLKKRGIKFGKYLGKRFGKTFDKKKEKIHFDSEDEYAPVVVEM